MAGLLGDVLPAVYRGADSVKRRVKGLLTDPRSVLGDITEDVKTAQDQTSAAFYQDFGREAPGGLLGKSDPAWVQQQADLGRQRLMDIAMQGLTVYHGSPHKFDKFDASKIGTGEGAQAYGHGLYLAENPAVAKEYAKVDPSVAPPPNRLFKGQELVPGTPEYHAGTLLERASLAQARKEVARWIKEGSPDAKLVEGWKKTLNTLNQATSKADFKVAPNSNLYKVDLPDDAIAKMLDWDKPLSQQAPEVRAVLEQIPFRERGINVSDENSVSDLLNGLVRGKFNNPSNAERGVAASRKLAQQGIPGIRYLDGGSRGAGSGTRNFVVFPGNEGLLNILERNGQGLLGAK